MNRIQDMAAIVPYMTCVGNHGKLNQTNIACCIILFFSLWTPASLQFPSRLVPAIESCQASTRHTEEGMLAAYYLRHCLSFSVRFLDCSSCLFFATLLI